MRFLVGFLIFTACLSTSSFAQDADVDAKAVSTAEKSVHVKPVSFNEKPKTPAQVQAFIDGLLGEDDHLKSTEMSSKSGAK